MIGSREAQTGRPRRRREHTLSRLGRVYTGQCRVLEEDKDAKEAKEQEASEQQVVDGEQGEQRVSGETTGRAEAMTKTMTTETETMIMTATVLKTKLSDDNDDG